MKCLKHTILGLSLTICSLGTFAAEHNQQQQAQHNLFKLEDVHGFLQFGTNHIWRGISFTNRAPEILGGLFIFDPSGFYGGVIGYNAAVSGGGNATVPMLGYKGNNDKVDYDVSIRYENYSKQLTPTDPNIFEAWAKVGYQVNQVLRVQGGVAYSPNYYFESGHGWYFDGRGELKLPKGFTLDGGIGYQTTQSGGLATNLWFKDYINWDVGIAKELIGATFGFRYSATNLSVAQCNGLFICKPAYVGYVKKTF